MRNKKFYYMYSQNGANISSTHIIDYVDQLDFRKHELI